MGISRVVNPFYELVPNFKQNLESSLPGQLGWTPIGHLSEVPQILEAKRHTPPDHNNIKFKIRNVEPTDFRKKTELPIPGMPLGNTEEYLVTRSKMRLCVLLARGKTEFEPKVLEALKGKKHITNDDIIVLPLYGVQSVDHPTGFPQVVVDRIRVLMYKQFTYFPPFIARGSSCDDSDIYEAVGRFDRLSLCSKHHKWIRLIDVKLNDEAFALLLSGLKKFLNLGADDNYEALVTLLQGTLQK